MLADLLKAAAPAILAALREFLSSPEGKAFVAEARSEVVKAILAAKPDPYYQRAGE